MTEKSSYGQILKSSSIMGGAAGINLLLGMIRTKFAAVLIGTTGIGLLAGFTSIQVFLGTLAGLGVHSSAVRDIATAISRKDNEAIGRAILTLRRVCWLTGLAGMAIMIAFSPWLSRLIFGNDTYTLDIAALGVVILMANLTGGRLALLQGTRRIGDMAYANILGALFATVSAVGFYTWLGLRGIVPSLISIAAIQLAIAWYFAHRTPIPKVVLSWRETFFEARDMVKLGLVFMWSGLLGSAVAFGTITLVSRQIDIHAVGIYSAAYALSGMFVSFVLSAMSADYYPRLTGVVRDKVAMTQLVNQQTEIGLLLALPGLLTTMILAPWILQIFYTDKFLAASELIHWFVLGCVGRIVSWPLGYVLLALGNKRWLLLTETGFAIVHLVLIVLGLNFFGIEGVAVAFFLIYLLHVFVMHILSKTLISFGWSNQCLKLLMISVSVSMIIFAVCRTLQANLATAFGLIIVVILSIYFLRILIKSIGQDGKLKDKILKMPGAKFLVGN